MNNLSKKQCEFIEKTMDSLCEVENFLCQFHKASDILKIIKITN